MDSYEISVPTIGDVPEMGKPAEEMTVSYEEGSSFVKVTINGQTVHLDYWGIASAMCALGRAGTDL